MKSKIEQTKKFLQPMTKVSYMLSVEELQEMGKAREDISRSLFSIWAIKKYYRKEIRRN